MTKCLRITLMVWLLGLLLLISPMALVWAATITGDAGDPVHLTGTNELDVQVLKMNGVIVGTVAPVIFVVRANQSLGAASVIQHAVRNDVIEIVQISSSGGALTSTASPRILAGVQGQIIALQGTSDSATYAIPDGSGVRLTSTGSALFNTRSFMLLRYDTTGSVWRELTPMTGDSSGVPLPVKVATTANITLSGTQTIDGVALTVTTPRQRVLVKNQTTGAQNGVYTVETSTWIRAVDFDEAIEARTNADYTVEEGTTQAGSQCHLVTSGAITLGSTSLAFTCTVPQVLTLKQRAAQPTQPGADEWGIYCLSTGCFIIDDLNNVYGPIGAAGGGSSTGLKDAAHVATTANITLSGEQTIDGVLTSANRVLVKNQSTDTQNGIYVSAAGAWSRAADADTSAEFTAGFLIPVQSGTVGTNTLWQFSTVGTFTLNTTTPTFAKANIDASIELTANRNAVSGNAGLTSEIKHIWTQNGDADTHATIAAASQITPTASTMRVAGSGGPVTMTSGDPRITGCTTLAMDGVELTLEGSHATNTLTMPTGQGVLLCGNTGSKIFGLNKGSTRFICNFSTLTWREANCPSLQDAANVGKDIFGASDIASAVRIGTDVNTHCRLYGKTIDCIESGATTDSIVQLSAGKDFLVKKHDGTTLLGVDNDTGVITGPAAGTRTTTIPLRLDTVNFADANAFVSPQDRTDYDTNTTEFLDAATGCAHYKAYIPPNVASVEAWNVIIGHSALSGSGGNVVLTLAAKTFGTNVAKSAAFTALTLPSSGVVAVSTSANTTLTTLGATTFDGEVTLAANVLLRLTLCRTGGSGSDTLGVSWLLEHIDLRLDVN